MKFKSVFILTFTICCFTAQLQAQNSRQISGKIVDSVSHPVPAVTVTLVITGTLVSFKTVTDKNGNFSFTNIKSSGFTIYTSSPEYEKFSKDYVYAQSEKNIQLNNILLRPQFKLLPNVEVSVSAIIIKEDTIEYKAGLFNVKEDAMVEDILKKLPGIDVGKNGTLTAQGKPVYKIKVNGKDFFGSDIKMATRELPANIIDKIQVIDDYGDLANVSGIKGDEPKKIINLQLKKDKSNGMFGNAAAGYGSSNSYTAKLGANYFSDQTQFSVYGNSNNNNNGQVVTGKRAGALPGVTTGGSINNDQNTSGGPEGVTTAHSAGVNYSRDFGNNNHFSSSYNFGNANTDGFREQSLKTIYSTFDYLNYRYADYSRSRNNHQLFLNIEMNPDSMSYLKISANLFVNNNKNQNNANYSIYRNTDKTSEGYFRDSGKTVTPNFSYTILYNRYFRKKGRNLAFSFTQSSLKAAIETNNIGFTRLYSNPGVYLDTLLTQLIDQNNKGFNYNLNINYTEPILKSSYLDFIYQHDFSRSKNIRSVYLFENAINSFQYAAELSNDFTNMFTSNLIGLNLRTVKKKHNFSIGATLMPVNTKTFSDKTDSLDISQRVVNISPMARFSYAFSQSKNLSLSYRGFSRQPNYMQLQPTRDISNQQYQTTGNPALRPEFIHTISSSYNSFNLASGSTLFSTINFSTVQNKIVSNTILLDSSGTQLSKPENLNGFYSVSAFYNYSKGFHKNKYVLKITGSYNFGGSAILVNSQRVSGNNWFLLQAAEFKYNNNKWLELGIEINYNLSTVRNLISQSNNYNSSVWTIANNMRFDLPGRITLKFDFEKIINRGLDSTLNKDLNLLNVFIEKKLVKKKSLYLGFAGYNILNKNFSLNRQINGNNILDTRSLQISRYFLFTLTYRWNRFGK